MVRIEKIELENYRLLGTITFEFPKKGVFDTHIIVATNGVGKTSMLNAINWCLYGDEPHKSKNDDNDQFDVFNTKAMMQASKAFEKSIPVKVKVVLNMDGQNYEFFRERVFEVESETQIGQDVFRSTTILPSGDTDIKEGSNASDIVEELLPKNIREYFFFDGDQLINYIKPVRERQNLLKEAIFKISGVNAVKKSLDHLKELQSETEGNIRRKEPGLETKTQALESARNTYYDAVHKKKSLEEQISKSASEIEEALFVINGREDILKDEAVRKEKKERLEELEGNLSRTKEELQAFVRKYMVLLSLYHVNRKTKDYIVSRQESTGALSYINIEAIEESLEKHECDLCRQHIPHDVEQALRQLVQKYKSNASLQTLALISNDIDRALDVNSYETEKKDLFDRKNGIEKKIKEVTQEIEILNRRIGEGANNDVLRSAVEKRDRNETLVKINNDKLVVTLSQLPGLKKNMEDRLVEYNTALAKMNELKDLNDRLKFIQAAIRCADTVIEDIVDGIKRQMEETTFKYFDKLVWKKDEYDHIDLDEMFRIRLYDKLAKKSCFGTCSEGEKQLMAMAFTIALHEVSGYNNMLFIDTPVGRLSGENRTNFVSVLLELSREKQVILAFTDDEYSPNVQAIMSRKAVSTMRNMVYDEEHRQVIVN